MLRSRLLSSRRDESPTRFPRVKQSQHGVFSLVERVAGNWARVSDQPPLLPQSLGDSSASRSCLHCPHLFSLPLSSLPPQFTVQLHPNTHSSPPRLTLPTTPPLNSTLHSILSFYFLYFCAHLFDRVGAVSLLFLLFCISASAISPSLLSALESASLRIPTLLCIPLVPDLNKICKYGYSVRISSPTGLTLARRARRVPRQDA